MRVHLRRLVLLLVLLLLGSGGVLLAKHLWRQRQADINRQILDLVPDVAQRIRDFHRVKVEGDRKVWEVGAREAQYDDVQHVVTVDGPVLSVYFKDGSALGLRGARGRIVLDEKELRQVEAEGEIRVDLAGYAITTDSARYDRAEDAVTVPGRVRITGEGLEIQGDSMRIDMSVQRMRLAGNVRMMLRPGA